MKIIIMRIRRIIKEEIMEKKKRINLNLNAKNFNINDLFF